MTANTTLPVLKPTDMLERLIPAELAFARFNALRTTDADSPAGIRRGANEAFEYLVDPTRPASTYYNRAVGRSIDSLSGASLDTLPPSIAALEVTPALLTPEGAQRLHERGFRPAYALCYLGVSPVPAMPVERDVARLSPLQVEHFFDLLELQGVKLSPEKRARTSSHYCTEWFQAYVARGSDGAVTGWATMFVDDGVAFLGNSFTLPQFRRTGAHRALLAARLDRAAASGLDVAFTDVEHGSQSHRNCEYAGFRTVAVNTIWRRA